MRFLRLLGGLVLLLIPSSPVVAQAPLGGPRFQPMGFGDVSYIAAQRQADGFFVGQLVGQLTAALTDRLTVFTEVSGTARSDGYALDIERLFLRYDFSDLFKLSAGRYHSPISYWNTAYHHGLWLQTTTSRPEMIRFGSRLIPVHFVGILAEGTLAPGALGLNYALGVGNGRSANVARAGDAGDVNDHRAVTIAVNWRPSSMQQFQAGGGAYIDRVPAAGTEPELRERILSAHVAWTPGTPEFIAEYARVSHAPDIAGAAFTHTHAVFAQASWGLRGAAAGFRPYARLENIDASPSDTAFTRDGGDYDAVIAGLRYDFELLAALKAEYRRERTAGDEWTSAFVVQASFAIATLNGGAM